MPTVSMNKGVVKIAPSGAGQPAAVGQLRAGKLGGRRNVTTQGIVGQQADDAFEGTYNWTAQVEVRVDTTANSSYLIVVDWFLAGGSRSVSFMIPDDQTGSISLTGKAVIENADDLINMSGGDGQPQVARFTLRGDGGLTRATVV